MEPLASSTDGRKLPCSIPTRHGWEYSTGNGRAIRWWWIRRDSTDQGWLDARGHPRSEALRVQGAFHRRDFGHMDVQATVEDPNILTMPVTIKFTELLIPNSDILENFCAEGQKGDPAHMPQWSHSVSDRKAPKKSTCSPNHGEKPAIDRSLHNYLHAPA